MTTSFNELRAYASTLDPKHPIFEALWDECWDCKNGVAIGDGSLCSGTHAGFLCHGLGYIPRSRAEAALRLPEACPQVRLRHARLPDGYTHHHLGSNQWWIATFPCPVAEHKHRHNTGFDTTEKTCLRAEASNWLDALSAVIMLREKETADA